MNNEIKHPQQLNDYDLNIVIHRWNDTEQEYPIGQCLHKFIEEQAVKTPKADALLYENETIVYENLNKQSNQLAHLLQKKGVGPESLVGVCAYRSIQMVIGLHAVLKAGGAYVPFDPTYPPKRLEFMINDSQVKIILAQRSCEPMLPKAGTEIIYFEDIEKELENYPSTNPKSDVKPGNLAYVIYTSGSTGNPKGVMNTHRAIVNRLMWMQDTFQIDEGDKLIQKTPFSFDVSVWELFWPFMFGARLVIARPEGHKDPEYLLDLIQKEGVNIIHFVPSMLHLFLDVANQERCSSLKHVVLSGEVVTMELQNRYFSRLKAPLHNLYGPTEAAVDVSYWKCDPESKLKTVPIGKPISNTQLYILDKELKLVSIGETGELHIGGAQVARGYLNRPKLTAEKFIPNPFSKDPDARLYKTGDSCRYLSDGNIEYIGRIDFQVKIRGNRVELGEIESVLENDPSIKQCAVMVREDTPGEKRLVAYLVEVPGKFNASDMRKCLAELLPDYMIPSVFVPMKSLPLSPSGKTDRRALPKPGRERPKLANPFVVPRKDTEKTLAQVWQDILQLDRVGIDDNFFELGGDSLLALKLVTRLHTETRIILPVVKLFEFPSIARLADFLDNKELTSTGFVDDANERATRQRIGRFHDDLMQDGVAIVGMAGRFPGAASIDQLWDNLCNDVESITFFSKDELGPGIEQSLIDDPDYVPARGIIEDADKFDAAFFGIGPLEARVMDPQHRVFLELAWAALENAGYDSESYEGMIGVYAGVGDNHYYPFNVLAHPDLVNTVGRVIIGYGNEKDYIATRASYAMNLTGPSVSANTGCSTTLLGVDHAFRALVDFECDMALAGGVDIYVPQKSGFLYEEGGIFTKDGHVRPFDSQATGTMFNDGAGIVVLKRLTDALAEGDRIYAVIRGTAKNNDGANKVSFLAPSVDGQAAVIAMAQAHANVLPEDISLIEAHGTGTPLGDPIEIEALTKVFRTQTDKKQFCMLGSIKGNIGHPTIASGVAGLIRAALCLYYEKIPATLHFKKSNPGIDFENSPFKVVDRLTPWPRSNRRRITGVSSFGFGGTNVHTIVEEAPVQEQSGPSRPRQLLLLSAKSEGAIDRGTENLAAFFQENADINLADAAFTLKNGRRYFANRRFVVCDDIADAVVMLENLDPLRSQTRVCEERDPEIVFMYPGQGAQYVNMGKNLYDHEPLFKETVDTCCNILQPHLGCDLRDFLYPEAGDTQKAAESLGNTYYTQPALFTIEYALSKLLMHWGIQPAATIGHSIGEFVGACLGNVFSLDDALKLVALRARLISERPQGSMLSVRRSAQDVEMRLPEGIYLAAANSPNLCVVSGPDDAIARFQATLEEENIACKRLHTSHAFHSAMMDPVVEPFTMEVTGVELSPPKIPVFSTANAGWMSEAAAMDPEYWGRHLRKPVRFSDGINELLRKDRYVFLEVGPRATLTTLTRQHLSPGKKIAVMPTLSDTHENDEEWTALLSAVGSLWLHGVKPDWQAFYAEERRQRIPLPAYPFERKSYWLDPVPYTGLPQADATTAAVAYMDSDIAPSTESALPLEKTSDSLGDYLVRNIEETSGVSLAEVDPSTTFLEMGMDSLLLSQLAQKIKSDFNVKIVFSQLMRKYSTVPLLSDHIRASTPGKGEEDREKAVETQKEQAQPSQKGPVIAPVTISQRGLWLSSGFSDALSCAYNESITLKLTGEVRIDLLEKALQSLVQKHDALRATFSNDGTQMTLHPEPAFHLQKMDLSDMDQEEAEAEFKTILKKDASTPFDLANGPLFRTHIVSMPEQEVYTVLTSHHIVCDGWSLDVLISDLSILYNRLLSDEIREPVPESYTFSDFARMASARIETDEYRAARSFWRERFRDTYPVLRLPADHPENRMGAFDAKRMDFDITGDVVQAVRAVCKKKGWSQFTVFVAAYQLMLYRISGQRDFVTGLPTAEQPLIGQEDLVGHCVNLVPLWCSVQENMTFEAYIDNVQHALIEAYDHQIYTFVDLLNEEGVPFDQRRASPLPAGLTNMKKYGPGDLVVEDTDVDYFANPRTFESFELYLNVIESPDVLELKCHFKTALFKPETIRSWIMFFKETIEAITWHPDAQIAPPEITAQRKVHELEESVVRRPADGEFVEKMLSLWQKIFGNSSIGPHDNFFYLGGHSLLAARLFAEIGKAFDKSIPLSALYDAPTVADLVRFIDRGELDVHWKSVVPIQSKGSRPPIFLVHGAEGNILLYRDLARYLGKGQPVYGIQSAGLDGKTEIDAKIENVARNYVDEIKQIFPEGPYYIGGYCLGGTIALEMAQQLMKKGDDIGLLFMIENYNIKTVVWPQPKRLVLMNKLLNTWYHAANLFLPENTAKAAFFRQKAKTELSRYKGSLQVSLSSLSRSMGLKKGLGFPHVKIDRLYDDALTHYEPKIFPGEIILFGAEKRLAGLTDKLYGWGDIAKNGIELHELPIMPRGSLVEPYVRLLAKKLKGCVERVI